MQVFCKMSQNFWGATMRTFKLHTRLDIIIGCILVLLLGQALTSTFRSAPQSTGYNHNLKLDKKPGCTNCMYYSTWLILLFWVPSESRHPEVLMYDTLTLYHRSYFSHQLSFINIKTTLSLGNFYLSAMYCVWGLISVQRSVLWLNECDICDSCTFSMDWYQFHRRTINLSVLVLRG